MKQRTHRIPAGSSKPPSWLQPGPWHPGSPTVFQTQGVLGSHESPQGRYWVLRALLGISGVLGSHWEPRGSSGHHWESQGPSVVFEGLKGPQGPSGELWGVSGSQWSPVSHQGSCWEFGGVVLGKPQKNPPAPGALSGASLACISLAVQGSCQLCPPTPYPRRPQVYRELSVGLDYCFQILKRLSFGKAVDLFGMEPEDKIKTEGGSCKKTDSAS